MTTTQRTESDLKELLSSFKDGLTLWQQQLSTKDSISKIKAAKVDNPIEELLKLCKIIHANTTKMGIIFQKPLRDVNAAYKQTQDLSSGSVLLVSLSIQLHDSSQFSRIYKDEILQVIRNLLSALAVFVSELISDEDDKRLVSVGKLWELVTQLEQVTKLGTFGILRNRLKDAATMIADGAEELGEWIEDPTGGGLGDDDDPFALSDDDEEEDGKVPIGDDDALVKEDYDDILPDARTFLTKIKLVKLLVSTVPKNVPANISTTDVDALIGEVKLINEIVDELIYKVIFENNLAEAKFWFSKLDKASESVVAVLRKINAKDEKKLKWFDVWQLKFKE